MNTTLTPPEASSGQERNARQPEDVEFTIGAAPKRETDEYFSSELLLPPKAEETPHHEVYEHAQSPPFYSRLGSKAVESVRKFLYVGKHEKGGGRHRGGVSSDLPGRQENPIDDNLLPSTEEIANTINDRGIRSPTEIDRKVDAIEERLTQENRKNFSSRPENRDTNIYYPPEEDS